MQLKLTKSALSLAHRDVPQIVCHNDKNVRNELRIGSWSTSVLPHCAPCECCVFSNLEIVRPKGGTFGDMWCVIHVINDCLGAWQNLFLRRVKKVGNLVIEMYVVHVDKIEKCGFSFIFYLKLFKEPSHWLPWRETNAHRGRGGYPFLFSKKYVMDSAWL